MTRSSKLLFAFILLFSLEARAQDTVLYVSPDASVEKGKAPGMTWKLLSDNGGVKEYAVIFATGDELVSGITDFAAQQHILSARFTAIGSLQEGVFGWYDPGRKLYRGIHMHRQMELLSLIGDIALYEGKPIAHAHASVSISDGNGQGGHLIKAISAQTVELFITCYPTPLKKMLDKETDVKIIHADLR